MSAIKFSQNNNMASRSSIVPSEGEVRVANVGYGAKKYEPKEISAEPRKSIVPRKSIAPSIRSPSDMSDLNIDYIRPEPASERKQSIAPERRQTIAPERRMSVFPAKKNSLVDNKRKCIEACSKCSKMPLKLPKWCLQKDYGGIVNILWFTLGVGTLVSAGTIFGLITAKVAWQNYANMYTYKSIFYHINKYSSILHYDCVLFKRSNWIGSRISL